MMDPDQVLADLRSIIETLTDDPPPSLESQLLFLDEITTKFEALDNWLTNKGYLPADWER